MEKIQEVLGTIQETGIPDSVIDHIRHRIEKSGATHPWAQICAVIQIKENENQPSEDIIHNATREIVQQIGRVLLGDDELNWSQRVEWCETPANFLSLFEALGIPDEKWKSPTWMTTQAKLPQEQGGINRTLSGFAHVIKKRFEYHSQFVAWMEGKSFTSIRQGIKDCKTREDFLRVFAEIGIPGDNWKNTGWLYNKAKLPPEKGGIGQQLGHIPQYIKDDARFESFPHFVAWMEGKDEPEPHLTERVAACETPQDFLNLFTELAIPNDNWKSTSWLSKRARLPIEEGGISRNLAGFVGAIRKDERFKGYREFVAWMEGKDEPDPSMVGRVRDCDTKEEFLTMFHEIGVPEEKWRTGNWFTSTSKLPPEKGGVGKNLSGIIAGIREDERFESFSHFVAWMDGESEPPKSWPQKIAECSTREEFLMLFRKHKIPDENWKYYGWLTIDAKEPPERGGINHNLSGLVYALGKDERFTGFKSFVAWMEGREPEPTYKEMVQTCKTPEDFLNLFRKLGIPDNKWETRRWLFKEARLPVEQGGIGRSLKGLGNAIANDNRFQTYRRFLRWIKGEKLSKFYEKPHRQSWIKEVRSCQNSSDFMEWFRELGIPGDAWKNSHWFYKVSPRPVTEGGVEKNLSGIPSAIVHDGRFDGFKMFVAWMEGREPEPTYKEMVQTCKTPEDFLNLFRKLGIPDNKWETSTWLSRDATLPIEQGGIGRSLQTLGKEISTDSRFQSYSRFLRWMRGEKLSQVYKRPRRQSWIEKVRSCHNPEDFITWFRELGIPGDAWKNSHWFYKVSPRPVTEGGVEKNLRGIPGAIARDARFNGFKMFLAWMHGKKEPDLTNRQSVERCQTREDFHRMFASLGVLGDEWKIANWLIETAKLPPEQGGIGKSGLTSLPAVIGQDPRFESFSHFVAWMEGKEKPMLSYSKRIAECQTRNDFLNWFVELGISGDKWKSSQWLSSIAKLPVEEGGIGKNLVSVSEGLKRDARFGSYRKFVAWMDEEEELDDTLLIKVRSCKTREEYLSLFAELGIPNGRWKSFRWMQSKPLLNSGKEEKHMPLEGILIAVRERFGSYKNYVAWMEGKDEPDAPWKERIAPLSTPNDFRSLFTDLGVPNEEWRNSQWLCKTAIRPPEEGGIGQPLQGLCDALRKRFNSFPKFVAWMDEKDRPEETMVDVVTRCRTPDDFLQFFREVGLPEDAWRKSTWFTQRAKLPPEKEGIGRNMAGFPGAIKNDERWDTYSHFKGWMQGKTGPVLSYPKQVALLETREDFIEWFADLGIPGDKWKDGPWLSDVARLPEEEGGIGKSMAAVAAAVRDDKRFGGYPQFVAWMEGEEYQESVPERVRRCSSREDYFELFRELGIPGDLWRNTYWIRDKAPLPPEEGGIGRNLHSLPHSIIHNNPKFGDYRGFVAWMDGMPLNGIQSQEEAEALLKKEAERLGVTVADLLDETKVHEYLSESRVLRLVMEYFSSLDSNSPDNS